MQNWGWSQTKVNELWFCLKMDLTLYLLYLRQLDFSIVRSVIWKVNMLICSLLRASWKKIIFMIQGWNVKRLLLWNILLFCFSKIQDHLSSLLQRVIYDLSRLYPNSPKSFWGTKRLLFVGFKNAFFFFWFFFLSSCVSKTCKSETRIMESIGKIKNRLFTCYNQIYRWKKLRSISLTTAPILLFFFPLEVAHYSNIMHSAFREKTGFLNWWSLWGTCSITYCSEKPTCQIFSVKQWWALSSMAHIDVFIKGLPPWLGFRSLCL